MAEVLCGNQAGLPREVVRRCSPKCSLYNVCLQAQQDLGIKVADVEANAQSPKLTTRILARLRRSQHNARVADQVSATTGIVYPGMQAYLDVACEQTKPTP